MIAVLFLSFKVCLLPINWNEAAQVLIISFDVRCTYAGVS